MSKLVQLIDKYGEIKDKIKELENLAEALKNEIKKQCQLNDVYAGTKYKVIVSERVTPKINPKKVYMIMKNKTDFFNCVDIIKTKLVKYLEEQDIDKCIDDYSRSIIISYSKIDE
jgi:hypothetical protein